MKHILHRWIIPIALFIGFIMAVPLTALSQKTLRLDLKKSLKVDGCSFKFASKTEDKLVRRIDIYDINNDQKVYTINLKYDSENRVIEAKCIGDWGMFRNTVAFYEIEGNTLKLSGYEFNPITGEALMPKTEAITCKLNNMGYIIEERATGPYADAYESYYEYDEYGQIVSYGWRVDNYSGLNKYEWIDDNIHISSYNLSDDRTYKYTSIVNKANINLNKLFTQTFHEDLSYFALFGYLGNKDKNLIEKVDEEPLIYTFDEDGYVIGIVKKTGPYLGKYVISYDYLSPDPTPDPAPNTSTTEEELGGAIDNAPEGSEDNPTEIFIPTDGIILKKPMDINKHIRLKGGKLIRSNDNPYAMLRIRSGYSLELDDITIDGNGVSQKDGSLVVYGKLKLKDGIAIKNSNRQEADAPSGAICVARGGYLIMEGGEISRNTGAYGSAVYNEGTFIMTGGEISSNNGQIGAVVNNAGGKFVMTGGRISSNKVTEGCGGVFVSNGCSFSMTGGEISNNEDCALYTWSDLQIGGQAKVSGLTLLNEGTHLLINSALRNKWEISFVDTPTTGTIVASGHNGYKLSNIDFQKIVYANNICHLKLSGNNIITYLGDTGVDEINANNFRLSISGDQVQVEGLPAYISFIIYGIDGKTVSSHMTDGNGQCSFTLEKGLYLLNYKDQTRKFLVK